MPEISVIIPVYKVEKYLERCLNSVLSQTFKNFEVICVNDGSPDKCGKILEKYAQKDKRVKVITQKNQGQAIARNNGIKKAKGKYIYFLDSDDYIHPQLLEICYEFATKNKAELVSFRLVGVLDTNKNESTYPVFKMDEIKYVITSNPLYLRRKNDCRITVNIWTKFYKKDLIKNLKFIPHNSVDDFPYTYAVLQKSPKTVALNVPLYYYVYNPVSISNVGCSIKRIKDHQEALNYIYKVYQKSPKKDWKFILRNLYPSMLKHQFNQIKRSPIDAQEELFKAFTDELKMLKENGCLSWRGHSFKRYMAYRKLLKNQK